MINNQNLFYLHNVLCRNLIICCRVGYMYNEYVVNFLFIFQQYVSVSHEGQYKFSIAYENDVGNTLQLKKSPAEVYERKRYTMLMKRLLFHTISQDK